MARKRKKKIFEILPLGKIIPNLATLSALFVGLTQIKFALLENWEYAIIAVIGASFLDAMDGRLARLLNACSRFGAELDSLSDFAVFGVAPSVVMYLYSLNQMNRIGWIVALFFSVCMALRLARFNTHDIENIKSPLSGKFFTGVPAPAGAVLALFPIILFNAFGIDIFKNPIVCIIDVILAGLLCISRIPTPSIKKFKIKREQYTTFLLLAILSLGVVYAFTWKAFCVIILLYISSIFACISKAKEILKNQDDQQTSDQ